MHGVDLRTARSGTSEASSSGAIRSVHHPKTFKSCGETLTEMYAPHPSMAGFIIDEPKCFLFDQSPAAVKAIGTKDAPLTAHYAERNQPGKENAILFPAAADRIGSSSGKIQTRERLGSLLKFYHQEAA